MAFLVFLLGGAGGFWLNGLIHQGSIEGKDSTIQSLMTQNEILRGKTRGTPEHAPQSRDPDTLYQMNMAVAKVPGGIVDRGNGIVAFPRIAGGPDINIQANLEFREFTIGNCHADSASAQKNGGMITTQSWGGLKCQILGLHP